MMMMMMMMYYAAELSQCRHSNVERVQLFSAVAGGGMAWMCLRRLSVCAAVLVVLLPLSTMAWGPYTHQVTLWSLIGRQLDPQSDGSATTELARACVSVLEV